MARLRRSDCSGPGISRRRRGRGFAFYDEDGEKIDDPEVLERIDELRIPPAWKNVWICPYPMGHLQATGLDARGRKQYLYHPKWRERRDQQKFDDMIAFAHALPKMRERVDADLARRGTDRERVLAAAIRLLELGFFRVGGEDYAVENETFGLATMKKSHVTLGRQGAITFDYPAKSGQRQVRSIVAPEVFDIVKQLKQRRGGSDELLAYRDRRRWVDVKSSDINAYLKEATGGDFSAKDFRTWNATVLAAVALAVSPNASASKTSRKRAITRAVKEVAVYLGNTPAVCRASYIDPRVFDRFQAGYTISGVIAELGEQNDLERSALHGNVEEAVLDLLAEDVEADGIESVDEVLEVVV
ncbi:MAG: DNA topoisomerase IB [Thermoleophilaceae bacterium]